MIFPFGGETGPERVAEEPRVEAQITDKLEETREKSTKTIAASEINRKWSILNGERLRLLQSPNPDPKLLTKLDQEWNSFRVEMETKYGEELVKDIAANL